MSWILSFFWTLLNTHPLNHYSLGLVDKKITNTYYYKLENDRMKAIIFCIATICFTNLALTSEPRDWSPKEEVEIANGHILA